jgi:bifunctional DNA-binding transcriptional regulator/antitoxin component of YhaV-PrlF toxin-antitoxin module
MVKFKTHVDKNGRIYLAKPLREAGIANVVEIQPNTSTAIIYREGTPLLDILASVKIILADLEHQLTRQMEREVEELDT